MGNYNGFIDLQDKEFDLVGLGEIMLRLSPPRHVRMVDSEIFEKRAGGSELNVVAGAAMLGLRTGIISKLPKNELGTFIKNKIRFSGVSDDFLQYSTDSNSRLGIYFYESGAAPRKPTIVYDRKNSAVNNLRLSEIPEYVYSNTKIFHVSGITPALGDNMNEITIELIKRFKSNGAKISFDVNYRANLWGEEEAKATIEKILPYVDLLFISEETSRRMFRKTGELKDIQKSYHNEYGAEIVATTQRTVISPRKHHFTSLIYNSQTDTYHTESAYTDIDVIDRIGSGDAYVSGALYGLVKHADAQKAVAFGNATSALKSTVPGDLPTSDLKEVLSIIKDHSSDGPKEELNR